MALPHPEAGILRFMNNIRFSLAMDPSRQLVQDHIQFHGFNFLDDYLEDVLVGPQRDGIVEVLKTPGRKRTKIVKLGTTTGSKLKNVISVSLEDDDMDKENVAPVNNFHRALLQAKDKDDRWKGSINPRGQADANLPTTRSQDRTQVTAPVVPVVQVTADPSVLLDQRRYDAHEFTPDLLAPSYSDQNLSIIAEDDESTERTRSSIHVSQQNLARTIPIEATSYQGTTMKTQAAYITHMDNQDITQTTDATNITPSNSTSTFHSIPLDTPEATGSLSRESSNTVHDSGSAVAEWRAYTTQPNDQKVHHEGLAREVNTLPHTQPLHVEPRPLGNHHTAFLPSIVNPSLSNDLNDTLTAPLPSPPTTASNTPTSPKMLSRKASVTPFPSLPAPMPLRKSMRAPREPSMGPGPSLQSAVAGPVVGGKRTSWLMKAREAKAIDESEMRTLGGAWPPALPSSGSKRKSGEISGGGEHEERKHKMAKVVESEFDFNAEETKMMDLAIGANLERQSSSMPPVAAPIPMDVAISVAQVERQSPLVPVPNQDEDEGMLDRLKRTLEGMGARTGKTMGKSLGGGAAASALAEARAAAEARVVERERKELVSVNTTIAGIAEAGTMPPEGNVGKSATRLSVSDLVSTYEVKEKEVIHSHAAGNDSSSTTPPNSPPRTRPNSDQLPPLPVFSKPSGPVFKPKPLLPVEKELPRSKDFSLFPSTAFSKPSPISVGLPARLYSPSSQDKRPPPLSAQSTYDSLESQKLFDDGDPPAWMPHTQDTEYSSGFGSQSQPRFDSQQSQLVSQRTVNDIDDDDDSWPLEERLAPQWVFGKDETMTWSTLTESRTGPPEECGEAFEEKDNRTVPGAFDMDVDQEQPEDYDDMEEMLQAGKSTVSLVGPKADRTAVTQSQLSMASSSSSSQSNLGIFSQASKLVSSVLGGSKKGKPEVKSLQLAAAAAKKQQEEKDKKAARMKEMENRRQLAIQRKAEEEKVRAAEEERKIKEEGERRKREREELTDKRPLKVPGKKAEEDNTKKRKIVAEKPSSKDKKDTSAAKIIKPSLTTSTKVPAKSALKQPTAALSSSATFNTMAISTSSVASKMEVKALKTTTVSTSTSAALKSKGKAKAMALDDEIEQPSQVLQTQMAARAKAQMQAARQQDPSAIPTESIELPDINSEYSDSEDEERPRTFDPPNWAQSPELRHALQQQSTVNPDDIFGPIRPLRMEEMFRTRQSRFRARTSSANWTGADGLTIEEERAYARRMGYR